MTNEKISYANEAALIATDLIEAKQHDDKASSLREGVNKKIVKLHKDKVVIGRYNVCAVATAFVDTLVQGGSAKKTAQNYLSLFKDAVKTGKPVLDWGGVRGGKSRKDAKGTKTKGSKAFVDLFRPAFNHDEGGSFEDLCTAIQAAFENAQHESLYDGFKDFFASHGDEIAE